MARRYSRYMKIQTLFLTLMYLVSVGVYSQTPAPVKFPYFCSFEDPVENNNWVFNSTTQTDMCNDRWYVGAATHTEGLKSLYISTNKGFMPNFGFTPNVVVAYREVTFPKSNNNYIFSFDWKNQATLGSGLYFCLIPKSQGAPLSNPNGAAMGPLRGFIQRVKLSDGSETDCMKGSSTWQTATLSIPINMNQPMYVCFVWQNNKTDTVLNTMGACVDNLQIVSSRCEQPKEFKVNGRCDTVSLSWYGTSANYQVSYRLNASSQNWRTVNVPASSGTVTMHDIIGLSEGVYDFRLCGINGNDTSAYASKMGEPVFCADNHCFNYVDLYDENTTCYAGSAVGGGLIPGDPYDYGIDEVKSRHTVCWVKNQYDPLTEYGLKLVPDGEIASVRLGNWNVNMESEQIDYKYHVDSIDPGILLLKYAVVLQDPGHVTIEQPYFKVTLLEEDGFVELDADCGKAEYSANRREEGWRVSNPYGDDAMIVTWKDWTTLGINLEEHRGKNITVRLTTKDCLQGAHFGYAYFTLGCTSGTIESVSCGATEDQEIAAPIGFDYQWFKEYDDEGNPTEVLSTDTSFVVPLSDTDPYYVRCIYNDIKMQKLGCHFDLSTIVSPRFPYPDMVLEHTPKDCKNTYRLRNRSHVILDYPDSVVHTKEAVSDVEWLLEDGSPIYDESPIFTAPRTGDTVSIRLYTRIGKEPDACIEDSLFKFVIPSILTDTVVVDTTICADEFPFFWENGDNSQWCGEPGVFFDLQKNYAGCDSVTKLVLHSTPAIEPTPLDTTICYGDSLVLDDGRGTRYVLRSSVERDFHLSSVYRCDSVIEVKLTVLDEIVFSLSHTDEVDAPATGSITITDVPEGGYYTLNGVKDAPLTGLRGGEYEVVVYNSDGCASEPQTVFIDSECIEIEPGFGQGLIACADAAGDTIVFPLTFIAGVPTYYRLEYSDAALGARFENIRDTFDVNEVTICIPDSCRPNRYDVDLVIEDIVCHDTTYHLTFDVYYSSDIMAQKWNDVIAVKNELYNGGYSFSAFRWFVNGSPIPGATSSYLYTSEMQTLDTAAEYHVELTRADDGVTMPACPIVPKWNTEIGEYPTLVDANVSSKVMLSGIRSRAVVSVYDILGRHYFTSEVFADDPYITLPDKKGVYLIKVDDSSDSDSRIFKVMIN